MKYVLILLFLISSNLILCTNKISKNQKKIKTQSNNKYSTSNSYYGNNYYSKGYYDDYYYNDYYYDDYYYDRQYYNVNPSKHPVRDAFIGIGIAVFIILVIVIIIACCVTPNSNQDDNVIIKHNQTETPIFVDPTNMNNGYSSQQQNYDYGTMENNYEGYNYPTANKI